MSNPLNAGSLKIITQLAEDTCIKVSGATDINVYFNKAGDYFSKYKKYRFEENDVERAFVYLSMFMLLMNDRLLNHPMLNYDTKAQTRFETYKRAVLKTLPDMDQLKITLAEDIYHESTKTSPVEAEGEKASETSEEPVAPSTPSHQPAISPPNTPPYTPPQRNPSQTQTPSPKFHMPLQKPATQEEKSWWGSITDSVSDTWNTVAQKTKDTYDYKDELAEKWRRTFDTGYIDAKPLDKPEKLTARKLHQHYDKKCNRYRTVGLERTCPATMGGRCHYVVNDNGQEQCERCERIKDEDVQQVQESDSHEEQKPQGGLKMWMCPRTMGGRCSFKTNDNGQEECRLCKRIKE